jgi:RNA polymerase sigma-70 factor, ECF subfamily
MDQAFLARLRMPTEAAWVGLSSQGTPTIEDSREQPDEVLLRLIGQGSKEALSTLFRRHCRQIWTIGRRILRDPAEAEDLVQEVFLYLYRRSALYDSAKGSAHSWLIQVTYTQALWRRRKLKSRGFYELPSPVDANKTKLQNCPTYDGSVEGLFGRNGWRRLQELLTDEQRETLRLHFFEGYTFAEIAEKLGESYGNVRNHHYRGLEKLRKGLADNVLNRR